LCHMLIYTDEMFTSRRALSDGLLSAMTRGLANEQWATVNGVPSGFE